MEGFWSQEAQNYVHILAARFVWTGVLSESLFRSFFSLFSVLIVWVRGSISIKLKKAGGIGNKIIGFCNYHSIFFNIASMKPTRNKDKQRYSTIQEKEATKMYREREREREREESR